MRNKKSNGAVVAIFIVISILIIALMLLFALDYVKKYKSLEDEAKISDFLRAEKQELEDSIAQLSGDKELLQNRIAELEQKIADLLADAEKKDDEIDRLLNQYVSDNEVLQILNEKIEKLEAENAEQGVMLDQYKEILSSSTGYRTDLISELLTKLIREAPMRKVLAPGLDKDTPKELRKYVEQYPRLSYYYYDITTGYSVSYNADEVMYSASIIKALYIYSILCEIEEFEYNKLNFDSNGNPLYNADGEPLFEGDHPNLDSNGKIIYLPGEEKYDLTRTWTFDKEKMSVEGSSEVRNLPDGATLTWDELIDYTLRFSDNIAFKQIRDLWGFTPFYDMVGEIGLKGSASGFMQLTAEDCVIFLKTLYEYFESGSEYAIKMRERMIASTHTVIISCCYPTGTVAHKYGWDVDAYNDMAIIYDENPYILVIMSDLDTGGTVVDSYLRGLVDLTKRIHQSAYLK